MRTTRENLVDRARGVISAGFLMATVFVIALLATVATASEKPKIVKRGTIDCDLVEATPVVFHDKLYRFEYVRDAVQAQHDRQIVLPFH